MTTDRLARIFEFYRINDGLAYYAGNGDVDGDGIPDRADTNDGNGLDCSGCQWAAFAYAWQPDPAPFPLGSTSTYAAMARDNGLFVSLGSVQQGDILLHAENGDIYHSDGPAGHTEMFGGVAPDGRWICWGSSGSGNGVGSVLRQPSFWQAAFRIPGLGDHSQPVIPEADLTPEESQKLNDLHAFMSEIKAPGPFPYSGALLKINDIAAVTGWLRDKVLPPIFQKLGIPMPPKP